MGFFFKADVSNDEALQVAIMAIKALSKTKDADYPMLQLQFTDTSINVLFVEGGHGGAVIYMRMKQAGSIDEKTCDAMIGECIHVDQLPSYFGIEFSYGGLNGECDSFKITGSIPTQHRKAQSEYIDAIIKYCNQYGIKYKLGKNQIGFLNWA
jgi:hypothetical protein